MKPEDFQEQLLKKLNAMTALLLDIKEEFQDRPMSARDKIGFLNNIGMGYKEIAQALGKSEGYIAVELSHIRKKTRKAHDSKGGDLNG